MYAGRFLPILLASEMPPRHFSDILEVPVKVILADPFGNVYVGVKDLAIVRLLDPHHGEHPLGVSILPGIAAFSLHLRYLGNRLYTSYTCGNRSFSYELMRCRGTELR